MLADLSHSPYRWLLGQKDTWSLYRQFHRLQGVKLKEEAHINIHEWPDPSSLRYNEALCNAIFHYSPWLSKGEQFKVCIAMEEVVKEAAWKYAHLSQILLDGTFGICNAKIFLFIIMAVDEQNRGVPLAFLMFSTLSENQRTAAGCNTDVLAHLLGKWKESLGSRNGE